MKSYFLYIEKNPVKNSYRYCNLQRVELEIPLQKWNELEKSIRRSKKYWLDFIWDAALWTFKTWFNYFGYIIVLAIVFMPLLYPVPDYNWAKEIDGFMRACAQITTVILMIRITADAFLSLGVFSRRVFFQHLEQAIMKEYPGIFIQKVSCK